jgi:hypothetical protein
MDSRSCHSFKNQYIVEFVKGVVLWTVWLERNNLCFNATCQSKTVAGIDMLIISLAKY